MSVKRRKSVWMADEHPFAVLAHIRDLGIDSDNFSPKSRFNLCPLARSKINSIMTFFLVCSVFGKFGIAKILRDINLIKRPSQYFFPRGRNAVRIKFKLQLRFQFAQIFFKLLSINFSLSE